MKRFVTLCLAFVFALCVCVPAYAQKKDPTQKDWAKFYRYEKLNAELLASGVRPDAVFMGNSITQNWAKYHPDFFKENNFVGRGIGGQTTSHMLVRFRRDVIERGRTPETVISRYERVVKEMHWEFIEPTKKFADIIMPQGGHNKKAIKALQMSISYFLK